MRLGAQKPKQTTPKRAAVFVGCMGMLINKNIYQWVPQWYSETANVTAVWLSQAAQKTRFAACFELKPVATPQQITPKRAAVLVGCLDMLMNENIHQWVPRWYSETAKVTAVCLLSAV